MKKAGVDEKTTQVPSLDEGLTRIYQTFLTPLTFLCQLALISGEASKERGSS